MVYLKDLTSLNLAFISHSTLKAKSLESSLCTAKAYKTTNPDHADVLIVLGGDGFMLKNLHLYQKANKPVYGMNCGTIGFLMNEPAYSPEELIERLKKAVLNILHPLKMIAYTAKGCIENHAINEVSILRETSQAAKIRILVNGIERLSPLIGDGLIISTPAGSTAYNFSAQGPILPLESSLVALTPLSTFRPRRWKGALLPQTAKITLEILEPSRRRVSATADNQTIRDVWKVEIFQDLEVSYKLLFDPGHNLEERILKEQFVDS